MKLITRDTDYAVRALIYIAEFTEEKVPVNEIVEELNIPYPFLRKILQKLNNAGILRSFKGKGGGFCLALPPERVYLGDLVEVFNGPFRFNECIFKKRICPDRPQCPLKKEIDELEDYVVSKLRSITIASLIGSDKKRFVQKDVV